MDIAVVAIIVFFGLIGLKTGIIRMSMYLVSQFAALIITYLVNPVFSKMLRNSPIFDIIKNSVMQSLDINEITNLMKFDQTELINSLDLQEYLKNSLLENNNPVVKDILNAETINDYIAGFLANIAINILSTVILFIGFTVLFVFVSKSLGFISKLPAIKQLNKTLGFIVGVLQGLIVIWVLFVVMTMFLPKESTSLLFNELDNSLIALKLYESNILLNFIMQVFA